MSQVHKSKTEANALQKAHEERRKAKEARRAEQAANVARKKKEKGGPNADGEEGDLDDENLDVDGLSDIGDDPEEALERLRAKKTVKANVEHDEDEDEFEYEDAMGDDEDDEEEDGAWDEDIGAGDVSPEEEEIEESSEDEQRQPPPKKSAKSRR